MMFERLIRSKYTWQVFPHWRANFSNDIVLQMKLRSPDCCMILDNLRLYRLNEPLEEHVKEFGQFKAVDFDGPLVV